MSIAERFASALSGIDRRATPLHHHSLNAYAVNLNGRPALLIKISPGFDREVRGTRGIEVHIDPVHATDRFISFRSEFTGMTPMFAAVVESLLDSTLSASDPEEGIALLLDNFEQLQAMFASRRGLLSEEAIRGLFAELLMILEMRDAGFGPDAAMNAWQGPYRSAKDFILTEKRCIEVKSLRRVNHRVRIANIDQLDPRDEDLRLAVVPLDTCAPGNGPALLEVIDQVRAWADTSPSARTLFDQALETLGFDVEDAHYRRWSFQNQDWSWFAVTEDFPRIRHEDVPHSITNVTYSLDIDQIEDFISRPFWHEEK